MTVKRIEPRVVFATLRFTGPNEPGSRVETVRFLAHTLSEVDRVLDAFLAGLRMSGIRFSVDDVTFDIHSGATVYDLADDELRRILGRTFL
jgi:hypothetical protein